MIVVDSNVIAYCWINGLLTATAQAVRIKDPDWHAPILWRSELRSILTGYLRAESLSRSQVVRIMKAVEAALEGGEHLVRSDAVFAVVEQTRLSAYDCEFVALARQLSAPLVTADRTILRECRDVARSMNEFLLR